MKFLDESLDVFSCYASLKESLRPDPESDNVKSDKLLYLQNKK
jgi:hypothetical protein